MNRCYFCGRFAKPLELLQLEAGGYAHGACLGRAMRKSLAGFAEAVGIPFINIAEALKRAFSDK